MRKAEAKEAASKGRLAALRGAARGGSEGSAGRFDAAANRLIAPDGAPETPDSANGAATSEAAVSPAPSGNLGLIQLLPLEQIRPDPNQPRRTFDESALDELASSIAALGVLQPVLVRRIPARDGGGFRLIAGERRWRAAQRAGLARIPAVIPSFDETAALEASLTENLQREDLTPLEEAEIFQRMVSDLGYSVRRLAERLGKGRGFVESRLALARLPDDLKILVAERPDTSTHAREIEAVDGATHESLRRELIERARAGAPLLEIREIRDRALNPPPAPALTANGATNPNVSLPDKVSGRPDTLSGKEMTKSVSSAPGEPVEAIVAQARALYQAIEAARSAPLPRKSSGLRDSLHRELTLTAAAIGVLLRRLDNQDEEAS